MEPSWILASKRFWGIIITGLSANLWVLNWIFGIDIDKETVGQIDASGQAIAEHIGILVGIALTIIGSAKAKGGWTIFPK